MKDYSIYVTEEIAKKAMEKGFEFDDEHYDGACIPTPAKPTAEQVCGWLREEFHLFPQVRLDFYTESGWYPLIIDIDSNDFGDSERVNSINEELMGLSFEHIEDAVFKGIIEALNLI